MPRLLYYSHIPALIIALFLGFFIFSNTKKSLAIYSLLGISIFFALWNISDLILWATNRPDVTMFFWSLQVLFEIIVFLLTFCFIYAYLKKESFSAKYIFLVSLPIVIFGLLEPTRLNLIGVNLTDCTAIENTVAKYLSYIIEAIVIIAISILSMEEYRKTADPVKRKEIALIGVGTILFLIMFIYGNLIGSFLDNWQIAQYGLFGMIVFMAFIVYLIVKYHTFNIKLLGAQALLVSIVLLIGSEFFFIRNNINRILTAITLVVTGVIGILLIKSVKKEVAQRERLEKLTQELEAANEKLKELDTFKSEVVSFAGHDLKSPIALIKQFATLIYDGTYSEPAQIKETSLKIKNTADRAVTLVENFLDLRKMEEGKLAYVFEEKNIVEFVKGITSDFIPLAGQKGLQLSFESKATEIKVKIDTSKLRQVIQNFLDNSLKYTMGADSRGQEHGPTQTGQNWIKVTVTEEQKSALICVSDSGGGMDSDLLPTLFEQFRRDPTTAKRIQGTGLGLYISKQIVLAHHGEIWAESEGKGKGSQFYVQLPKI